MASAAHACVAFMLSPPCESRAGASTGGRDRLLHCPRVHPRHPHPRLQRPGSLALATACRRAFLTARGSPCPASRLNGTFPLTDLRPRAARACGGSPVITELEFKSL